MATLLSTPALPCHGSALVRGAVNLSQVVFQGLLGAREGHLRPREAVSWKAPDVHRLVERHRLAARDLRREDGYGRYLSVVRIEADDLPHLDLQPRLLEHLALRCGLGPLTALYKPARESPLAVARFDVALDQDYTPIQLYNSPRHEFRAQVEHEAATLAHEPLRITAFEQADSEAVATPGAEPVLGQPILYFQGVLRLLEPRPVC